MSNEKQFSQGFTPNLPLWSFQLQKDSKLALKTRKDLEIHLITRALKDESFRAELIANPKAVIEQEIGSKLPDELEIMVLEETEDTVYMVLPCNPYEGLSEEELKASLGMTYEDVARWLWDQQTVAFIDEETCVTLTVKAWSNDAFKIELVTDPKKILEDAKVTNIPDELNIQIKFETPNELCIMILKSTGKNLSDTWQNPEIKEHEVLDFDLTEDGLSDIGIPLKKSEELSREIRKLFDKHQVSMTKETVLSIAYSTDLS